MTHRLKIAASFVAVVLMTVLVMTKSNQTINTLSIWGDPFPQASINLQSLLRNNSVASGSLKNSPMQASATSQKHKIANPAAVYCTDMGYKYQVISDGAGGETDICSMPDGVVCGAWDFLEGKCGQPYSYCARQGLGVRTATDGRNSYSPEYAVCVNATGKDVDSATNLDNISTKLNRCSANAGPPGIVPNQLEVSNQPSTSSNQPLNPMTGEVPTAWDWRNATFDSINGDWTSPVKDQGGCGSCWAFATVGQAEAVLNLAADNPNLDKDLAEEYLVSDCSSAGSCCGGSSSSALDFIKNSGVPDEACLPYVSGSCGCYGTGSCSCTYSTSNSCANSTCSQRCSDYASRVSTIDSYGPVSSDPTAIKQALITYGPLSVNMDMEEGSFVNGLYTCSNPTKIDHSVLIVGYSDSGGYWIVKNSWGSTWNGNGFFNVGYGQCLIENYVDYAYKANPNNIQLTVSTAGIGIGTVTSNPGGINCGTVCMFAFPKNTVVTLTAVPSAPSTFNGWSDPNCPGTGTCSVTMSAAKSVTANFSGAHPISVVGVYTTDPNGFSAIPGSNPQALPVDSQTISPAAVKTIYNPGDTILLWIEYNNPYSTNQTAAFAWIVKDPMGNDFPAFEWSGTLTASAIGGAWILGPKIPLYSPAGDYTFTGKITFQGIDSSESTTFHVNSLIFLPFIER